MKKALSLIAIVVLAFNVVVAQQQEVAKEKPACFANKEACANHKAGHADGKACCKVEHKECKKKCDKNCTKSCCAKASTSADAATPAKQGCTGHWSEGHEHGHEQAAPKK